jgi:hypothetical protein
MEEGFLIFLSAKIRRISVHQRAIGMHNNPRMSADHDQVSMILLLATANEKAL